MSRAIGNRSEAPFDDPVLQATREFVASLLASGHVLDDVHDSIDELIGERVVVDLVGTVGYYCLVSLTLTAFEVAAPADAAPLLEG